MRNYRTKQRDLIFNILKEEPNKLYSVAMIKNIIPAIGVTTVYRSLELFLNKNIIRKEIINNEAYYQLIVNDHSMYFKCIKCGSNGYIDCHTIDNMNNHLQKEHNFHINYKKTIINGLCDNCYRMENKK